MEQHHDVKQEAECLSPMDSENSSDDVSKQNCVESDHSIIEKDNVTCLLDDSTEKQSESEKSCVVNNSIQKQPPAECNGEFEIQQGDSLLSMSNKEDTVYFINELVKSMDKVRIANDSGLIIESVMDYIAASSKIYTCITDEFVKIIHGVEFQKQVNLYVNRSEHHKQCTVLTSYVTALIICLLYTGRFPNEIWSDIDATDAISSNELYAEVQNIFNLRLNGANKDLVKKAYSKTVKSTMNNVIQASDSEPLIDAGMPSRLAVKVAQVLKYPKYTVNFSDLYKSSIHTSKRETNFNNDPAVVLSAGCTYSGIKHAIKACSSEDYCGSFYRLQNSSQCTNNVIKKYIFGMFVADGISGASVNIGDTGETTASIGSKSAGCAFEKCILDRFSNDVKIDPNKLYEYLCNDFENEFYSLWLDEVEKQHRLRLGEVPLNVDDYTTTFSGVFSIDDYIVAVKIGNSGLLISNRRNPKTYITITDNCDESIITAGIVKGHKNPEYWNYLVMPLCNIKSVLMFSDGANNLMMNKKIKYHNMVRNCSSDESPFVSDLIDELISLNQNELVHKLNEMVHDVSCGAPFLGGSSDEDDVSIAFARYV